MISPKLIQIVLENVCRFVYLFISHSFHRTFTVTRSVRWRRWKWMTVSRPSNETNTCHPCLFYTRNDIQVMQSTLDMRLKFWFNTCILLISGHKQFILLGFSVVFILIMYWTYYDLFKYMTKSNRRFLYSFVFVPCHCIPTRHQMQDLFDAT